MYFKVMNVTCEYPKCIPKFGTQFYQKTDPDIFVQKNAFYFNILFY